MFFVVNGQAGTFSQDHLDGRGYDEGAQLPASIFEFPIITPNSKEVTPDHCLKILFTLIMVAVIVTVNVEPLAQNPDYHRFADQRSVLGIANFYNVISNLPLVIIGVMGLHLLLKRKPKEGPGGSKRLYLMFFAGVSLTGSGSAYYHYHPDSQTLLWDRLPMTIGFMAFSVS